MKLEKKKKKKKDVKQIESAGFWLANSANAKTFETRHGFHDSVFRTLMWLVNIWNAWNVSETMIWLAKTVNDRLSVVETLRFQTVKKRFACVSVDMKNAVTTVCKFKCK